MVCPQNARPHRRSCSAGWTVGHEGSCSPTGASHQYHVGAIHLREPSRNTAIGDIMSEPLDSDAILALLPHRYPMVLVDRVLEVVPGKRAVGLKNVSVNEPYFQ